ncbi:MAG: RNA polymerase sigma factor SigF [Thermoleophilia bacterium]|nr:RNA polymerase sigma factor SigF [Thermoleophilia bacterium]
MKSAKGTAHSSLGLVSASGQRLNEMDEKELLKLAREHGDAAAREELIRRYLPLVRSLARRFAGRGQPVEDLVQVGAIGLIKAIDRFDLGRGVELSTYATPTILGEIKRYFRDKGWAVKVPRALQDLGARLNKAIEDLGGELNRSPTIAELAEAVSASEEEVVEALESLHAQSSVSLFATGNADSDEPGELLDYLGASEEAYETFEQRGWLAPAMARLEPRERLILHLRFYEGLTQTEIAARVGISQMHVSRLIRKSLESLYKYMTESEPLTENSGQKRGHRVSS